MARRRQRAPRDNEDSCAVGQFAGAARPIRPWMWYWIAVTAVGLLLRIVLIVATRGLIYPIDHDAFVCWGIQATDEGVLGVYDRAAQAHPSRIWQDGQPGITERELNRVCNYPPLALYLFYGSGLVFRAVSADRLIDTAASRLTFCGWSILGDLALAAGCAAIVARLRPGWAARLVYLLAVVAPPFWWDSVIWGQIDTVVLAPLVWMLYAMLRERWLLAGALWGIALGLKPQAVLFTPVWGLAVVTVRGFWRPLVGMAVAGVVVLVAALPFLAHSGWTWFVLSYKQPLVETFTHLTTLKAFNIWYLDLLLCDSADAGAMWFGVAKAMWGKVFLAAGLLAGFAFIVWRWRRARCGLLLWTCLSLLAFVMLPTQVHERYIVLVLPFLGAAAALSWRLWPGLLLLVIVSMAQMTWPVWLTKPAGQGEWVRERAIEMYAQRVARTPEGFRDRMPSRDEFVERVEANYRAARRDNLRSEWIFTALALLGAVMTVAATVSVRPKTREAWLPSTTRSTVAGTPS